MILPLKPVLFPEMARVRELENPSRVKPSVPARIELIVESPLAESVIVGVLPVRLIIPPLRA